MSFYCIIGIKPCTPRRKDDCLYLCIGMMCWSYFERVSFERRLASLSGNVAERRVFGTILVVVHGVQERWEESC